jgi:hypothetical protein
MRWDAVEAASTPTWGDQYPQLPGVGGDQCAPTEAVQSAGEPINSRGGPVHAARSRSMRQA